MCGGRVDETSCRWKASFGPDGPEPLARGERFEKVDVQDREGAAAIIPARLRVLEAC